MHGAKPKQDWVEVEEQDGNRADLTKPDVAELGKRLSRQCHDEIRINVGSFTVTVTDDFNEAAFTRVVKALSGVRDSREAVLQC